MFPFSFVCRLFSFLIFIRRSCTGSIGIGLDSLGPIVRLHTAFRFACRQSYVSSWRFVRRVFGLGLLLPLFCVPLVFVSVCLRVRVVSFLSSRGQVCTVFFSLSLFLSLSLSFFVVLWRPSFATFSSVFSLVSVS